jgi:PDZ domain-containing protein
MTEDDQQMPGAAPVPDAPLPPSAPWSLEPTPAPAPTTVPELFEPVGTEGPPPVRVAVRRRRRWPVVVLALFVVVVVVASRWNLNYYALQPGSAQSVQQFITVPPTKAHPVRHPVLLTDVQIARVNALSYLYYQMQGDTSLEQVDDVTGGTAPSQLNAQGDLEMSQAEAAAKTAALRRLGYTVTATPSGAVIFGTFPGTPAYEALNVGDVVTAVNGVPTPTARALTTILSKYHSGQTVILTVRKGGTAAPAPVPVTLRSTVVDLGAGENVTLDLGIEPEDQIDYAYPFPVTIDVTNIGGPSAGLAMTLGVIDALTSGSVTGGRTVAATGTIDSAGDVGDVGGVAQKTVAVENAGASIFLVPPQEYGAAMSKDRPGLKVYAVSTLDQALRVLAEHGGSVPATPTGSSAPSIAAG